MADLLAVVVAAIVGIWGVYQTYITSRLSANINKITVELDQRVARLHHLRELIGRKHAATIYLFEFVNLKNKNEIPDSTRFAEVYAQKMSEHASAWAELRGLARAIDDEELWRLINDSPETEEVGGVLGVLQEKEILYRAWAQQIHTRIAELLIQETKKD